MLYFLVKGSLLFLYQSPHVDRQQVCTKVLRRSGKEGNGNDENGALNCHNDSSTAKLQI